MRGVLLVDAARPGQGPGSAPESCGLPHASQAQPRALPSRGQSEGHSASRLCSCSPSKSHVGAGAPQRLRAASDGEGWRRQKGVHVPRYPLRYRVSPACPRTRSPAPRICPGHDQSAQHPSCHLEPRERCSSQHPCPLKEPLQATRKSGRRESAGWGRGRAPLPVTHTKELRAACPKWCCCQADTCPRDSIPGEPKPCKADRSALLSE